MPEEPQQQESIIRTSVNWLIHETRHNIFFGILSLLLIAFVAYLLSPLQVPLPFLNEPTEVLVYEECYHIGDVTLDAFCHPVPQSNPFETRFQLKRVGDAAHIQVRVVHVDPDEINAPVRIYLNGEFVDYLNRYVSEETFNAETVRIPIQPNILRVGNNNILILVGNRDINQAYKNVDDIEFSDLRIQIN